MTAVDIQYGGFWRRLAALVLDLLILFLPLAALEYWGADRDRPLLRVLFWCRVRWSASIITCFWFVASAARRKATPATSHS